MGSKLRMGNWVFSNAREAYHTRSTGFRQNFPHTFLTFSSAAVGRYCCTVIGNQSVYHSFLLACLGVAICSTLSTFVRFVRGKMLCTIHKRGLKRGGPLQTINTHKEKRARLRRPPPFFLTLSTPLWVLLGSIMHTMVCTWGVCGYSWLPVIPHGSIRDLCGLAPTQRVYLWLYLGPGFCLVCVLGGGVMRAKKSLCTTPPPLV